MIRHRLRRRMAVIATAAIIFGALIAIAPNASAGSLAEGVHRAERSCTGTMGNNVPFAGTMSVTWKIEFLQHKPAPGERDEYRFTLLDALYTGTVYRPGAYPTVDVSTGSGGSGATYVAGTNGGLPVYNQVFGDNWPATPGIGPITVATLGTAPAVAPDWAPFQINTPEGAGNNFLRFNFGDDKMKNNCIFFVDLGLLNEPVPTEFGMAKFVDCAERVEDQPTASRAGMQAALGYKLAKNPGSNGFSLTDMAFTLTSTRPYYSGPSTPWQWYDQHHLTLHSGDGLVSYLDPTGGIEYPGFTDNTTHTLVWPDAGALPSPHQAPQDAMFDYTDGDPAPYIEWEAQNSQDAGDTCSQRWYLGVEFDDTGLDPDLNWSNTKQYTFDDCKGGFGTVGITAGWATDFNEQFDRPTSLTINNSSTNRITIEPYLTAGNTALSNRSPQFKTVAPDRVFVSGGHPSAERIVNPTSNKSIDITTASKWYPVYGDYAAPAGIRPLAAQELAVKVTLRAWIPNPANLTQWIPCTAADVDLRNLQLKAIDL